MKYWEKNFRGCKFFNFLREKESKFLHSRLASLFSIDLNKREKMSKMKRPKNINICTYEDCKNESVIGNHVGVLGRKEKVSDLGLHIHGGHLHHHNVRDHHLHHNGHVCHLHRHRDDHHLHDYKEKIVKIPLKYQHYNAFAISTEFLMILHSHLTP